MEVSSYVLIPLFFLNNDDGFSYKEIFDRSFRGMIKFQSIKVNINFVQICIASIILMIFFDFFVLQLFMS